MDGSSGRKKRHAQEGRTCLRSSERTLFACTRSDAELPDWASLPDACLEDQRGAYDGIVRRRWLAAPSRLSKHSCSFDHLVGAGEKCGRNG